MQLASDLQQLGTGNRRSIWTKNSGSSKQYRCLSQCYDTAVHHSFATGGKKIVFFFLYFLVAIWGRSSLNRNMCRNYSNLIFRSSEAVMNRTKSWENSSQLNQLTSQNKLHQHINKPTLLWKEWLQGKNNLDTSKVLIFPCFAKNYFYLNWTHNTAI